MRPSPIPCRKAASGARANSAGGLGYPTPEDQYRRAVLTRAQNGPCRPAWAKLPATTLCGRSPVNECGTLRRAVNAKRIAGGICGNELGGSRRIVRAETSPASGACADRPDTPQNQNSIQIPDHRMPGTPRSFGSCPNGCCTSFKRISLNDPHIGRSHSSPEFGARLVPHAGRACRLACGGLAAAKRDARTSSARNRRRPNGVKLIYA